MSRSHTALLILRNSDKFFLLFPTFSKFYQSNSRSCCHRCFTSTTGVQSVPQITKTLYKINKKVDQKIFLHPVPQSLRLNQYIVYNKPFARVQVTLLIFAHLPCTHSRHSVHITKFAISLLPHLAHQSTLLLSTSPFEPLTIILVLLRFAFNHLLSNVYFPFRNFSLKSLYFYS